MQINVSVTDANNIVCEVVPPQQQIVVIDRGVEGNGIVSIVPVTISTFQYLRITYTNGTVQDVGPLTSTAYTATSPITIVGNTISLTTVPIALGGTDATTAAGAIQNLLPSYTGNANKRLGLNSGGTALEWVTDGGGTVTSVSGTGSVNGLTLTGTVTSSGSLTLGGTLSNVANSALTNSAITINGTSTSLGGSINVGTVTSVAASGGTTGLTFTGSPITTSGTLTLGGTLAIANGGTGQTTANAAFNALAPSQTGNSGKYLTTDGTDTSWATNPLGTVTSVAATVPSFLSISGSPITTSGTLAFGLSGTALPTTSGGTGLTSFTANGIVYASSTSALATSPSFTYDGSTLLVGATSSAGVGNSRLQIGSTSSGTSQTLIQSTTTALSLYASSTAEFYLSYLTGSALVFGSGPVNGSTFTERARITSNGDLLVGLTTNINNYRMLVSNDIGIYTATDASGTTTLRLGSSVSMPQGIANIAGIKTAAGSGVLTFSTGSGGVTAEVGRFNSSGQLQLGTSSTYNGERLVVDSNGGSAAYNTVFVNSSTSSTIYSSVTWRVGEATTAVGYVGTGGSAAGNPAFRNNFVIGTQNSTPLVFNTADAEKMRLDTAGNLGLGASSPTKRLQLGTTSGGAVASPIAFQFADDYSNGYTAAQSKLFLYNLGGSEIYGIGTGPASDIQYHAGGAGNTLGRHAWYSGNSEKMRLDASGNLGIGTSSPSNRLHIRTTSSDTPIRADTTVAYNFISLVNSTGNAFVGSNGNNLIFQPAGTTQLTLSPTQLTSEVQIKVATSGITANAYLAGFSLTFDRNADNYIYAGGGASSSLNLNADNSLKFNVGSGFPSTPEIMRVTSTGLGIGTTSPSEKLEVAGAIKVTGTNVYISPSTGTSATYLLTANTGGNFFFGIDNSTGGSFGAGAYGRVLYSGGAYPMVFYTNDLERARIDSSGNLLVGTTTLVGGSGITAGTTSSGKSITVISSSYANNGVFNVYGTDGGLKLQLGATSATSAYMYAHTSCNLEFYSNGSSSARLDTSGQFSLTKSASFECSFSGNGLILSKHNVGPKNAITSINDTSSILLINNSAAGWDNVAIHTAGSERARVTSGGNLLVGTTSAMNGVGSDGKQGFQASPTNIVVQNTADDNIYLAKGGGYSIPTFVRMSVNGGFVGSISTNGTSVQLNNISAITFPATQVASSDANTLDDYEEGSWTPVLSGSGGGSYTMGGSNSGRYIKIGKMVWATATLQWTGQTTAYSGNLWVAGLPFTCTGNRGSGSMGAISYGLSFTSGYGEWNYLIDPNQTAVYIIQNSTSGSGYNHSPTVGTTGLVYAMSIVYEASN